MKKKHALSDTEKLDWLRLIRSPTVGPITFHKLLARFGSIETAIKEAPELAKRGGRAKPLTVLARSDAEKEIEALHKFGGYFVAMCEDAYPSLLAEIEDAPPVLAVLGQRNLLKATSKNRIF